MTKKKKNYSGLHTAAAINGEVLLSNDDDPYYEQAFNNREELQAFVDHLWQVADEAWPT